MGKLLGQPSKLMTNLEKFTSLALLKVNWLKFSLLSMDQRKVLLGSLLLLPLAALLIKIVGLSAICQWQRTAKTSTKLMPQTDVHRVSQISRMVDVAASRGWYKANCLKRALVLQWWLNREGIPSDLVFGVDSSMSNGVDLKAHAWIEVDGEKLGQAGIHAGQHITFVNPFHARSGSI